VPQPKRFKILVPDDLGRWQAGDVGIVTESQPLAPYFCELKLDGTETISLFGKPIEAQRVFSFYREEVEPMPEPAGACTPTP
jgi:hypothetical protein